MPLSTPNAAGLRSRKIDQKKPLAIFRAGDLEDSEDIANINRALLNISTGVEKEEEEEHHLQVALNRNYVGIQHSSVYIPTPDASRKFDRFDHFYSATFDQPKTLIKFSSLSEDCAGCPYNIDEKDSVFLRDHNARVKSGDRPREALLDEDSLEQVMWSLEKLANEKIKMDVPLLDEVTQYFEIEYPDLSSLLPALSYIYEWWRKRRYEEREGFMIAPQLKTEEIGPKADQDPYICFRRRELKSLRKRGRTDNQSLEKLNRLRSELHRARDLLEMVIQRERMRNESFAMEKQVFEARVQVRYLKKKLGITIDKEIESSPERSRKKMRTDRIPLGKFRDALTDAEYRNQLAGVISPFFEAVKMEEKAKQKKIAEEKAGWFDATEHPFQPYPSPDSSTEFWTRRYNQHSHSDHMRPRFGRKRVGRGGRVYIDRHIRRSDIEKAFQAGLEPNSQSSREWMEFKDKWSFDQSDDEIDESEVELEETAQSFAWRAFNLCATTDQECRNLITRPVFPEQINPQPTPPGQRNKEGVPPPQVVRQPLPNVQSTQKKKSAKPIDANKNAPPIKKKQVEPLDPRAATIKAMMQQAQRQAQATQLQIQQQMQSKGASNAGGNSSNPGTPVVPTGAPGQQLGGSATTTGGPASPSMAAATPPVGTPKTTSPSNPAISTTASVNKPAVAPPNLMAQPMRMPPFRMQQPQMPGGMPMPPNMPGLTPQQLQQMYYQAATQQQLLMASQQAQAVLQGRVRMNGPGNPMMMNPAHLQAMQQMQVAAAQANQAAAASGAANAMPVSSPLLTLQQQLMNNKKMPVGVQNPFANMDPTQLMMASGIVGYPMMPPPSAANVEKPPDDAAASDTKG